MSYRLDGRVQFYPVITEKRVYDPNRDKVTYREGKPQLCRVSYLAFTVPDIQQFFPEWRFKPGDYVYISGEIHYQITDMLLPTFSAVGHHAPPPLAFEKVIKGIDIYREYETAKEFFEYFGGEIW